MKSVVVHTIFQFHSKLHYYCNIIKCESLYHESTTTEFFDIEIIRTFTISGGKALKQMRNSIGSNLNRFYGLVQRRINISNFMWIRLVDQRNWNNVLVAKDDRGKKTQCKFFRMVNQSIQSCTNFKNLGVEKQWDSVKGNKVCFVCLRPSNRADKWNFKKNCNICR